MITIYSNMDQETKDILTAKIEESMQINKNWKIKISRMHPILVYDKGDIGKYKGKEIKMSVQYRHYYVCGAEKIWEGEFICMDINSPEYFTLYMPNEMLKEYGEQLKNIKPQNILHNGEYSEKDYWVISFQEI